MRHNPCIRALYTFPRVQNPNAKSCINPGSHNPHHPHLGQTALGDGKLSSSSVDPAKSHGLVVGQGVQGVLANVEARGGMVNGKDLDGLGPVGEQPAGSALSPFVSICRVES